MTKRFIFFLLLVLILSSIVYNIFQKLGEQSKVFQEPQNFFPPNPVFFLEAKDFSKTFHHFFETSMIWSKFEEVLVNSKYSYITDDVNKLLADSNCNEIFNGGTTNISFYNVKGEMNWIIVKNFLHSNYNKPLEIDSKLLKSYFFSVTQPFIIISNSKELINEFNSNYKSNNEALKFNTVKEKMIFSSDMSNISCFVNINKLQEFLNSSSLGFQKFDFINKLHTKNWIQFDINYSPNNIKIVGITDFDSLVSLSSPEYYAFKDWIPDDVDYIDKRILKIKTDSLGKFKTFKSLELKFKDLVQEKEHEILVLENNSKNIEYNELSKFIFSISSPSLKNQSSYNVVDSSLLKPFFPNIIFKNKFGFLSNQFLLIANLESKQEFDYIISQRNSRELNSSVFSDNKNIEFDQSHSRFSYYSQQRLLKSIELATSDLNNIIYNIFKSVGGLSWTINNYNNRIHHGLNLKKFSPRKVDKKILWKVTIPHITWGPFTLNNHRSGTKDIIVQDKENTIHLISAGGKIKWSRSLESKILGDISQIDAYKNNKYQMVFNTKSKLHIVDILGNEIDDFPIKFSYEATNPLAVFDYDLNKDYRFLVVGDDNKIHNYNISGSKVSGWINPELSSRVNRALRHFAINGLDYIFSVQNNGTIKLHNRRGGERFTVKNNLELKKSADFSIRKSFIIDSTSIIFEDSMNGISELLFGGSVKKIHKQLDDTLDGKYNWKIFSNTKFNKINYCLKGLEKLKIIDQSDEIFQFQFYYPYTLLHDTKYANYIAVLNNSSNEIQLIDSKFNINPNLFRASRMSCIGNINNDKSKELITIINNNILICYQIPSLN